MMKIFSIVMLVLQAVWVKALDLDINDLSSIHKAQALVAVGLLDYYPAYKKTPGAVPGLLEPPYYWWETSVAMNALLDYVLTSHNDTFQDLVKEALLFQTGPNNDYMPSNQTTTEGNDDQGFWGIAAMTAAESNFSNPGKGEPQWLYLAQSVFNTMAARWETGSCNGGLRWQIYPWNSGWTYKNSVGNGCLFHIGARLARYTDNETYVRWAEKVWDWTEGVKFIENYFDKNSTSVFDGADMAVNCTDIRRLEWTYNSGLYMSGCAYMYKHTNDTKWRDRAYGIWNRAKVFFNADNKIMYEAACQPSNRCNNDQRSFKGIYAQFLGQSIQLLPEMSEEIMTYLNATSVGVAQSCSGGTDGHTCGLNWFAGKWDGVFGAGEQISALGLLNSLLVYERPEILTSKTGGTSKGDGAAGSQSNDNEVEQPVALDIETKDKAGAGIITALAVLLLCGAGVWLIF